MAKGDNQTSATSAQATGEKQKRTRTVKPKVFRLIYAINEATNEPDVLGIFDSPDEFLETLERHQNEGRNVKYKTVKQEAKAKAE